MNLSEFLTDLLARFEKEEVDYCILRNYERLPNDNTGKDIDILIRRSSLNRAIGCIKSTKNIRITGFTQRQNMTALYIYGVQWGNNRNAIKIDLISARTWKGFHYLPVETVLEYTESKDPEQPIIRSPAPHHEAIISLFGHYLSTGSIKQKYAKEIRRIFTQHADQVRNELSPYLGKRITDQLAISIEKNNQEALKRLRRKVVFALIIKNIGSKPLESLFGYIKHSFTEFILLGRNCNSLVFAFLGPDGAGKSTLIEQVSNKLDDTASNIKLVHLKPTYLFKGRIAQRGIVTDPHQKEPRSKIVSVLKLIFWICELWVDRFFNREKNYSIKIYDRYFDDVSIDPIRYRYSAGIKFAQLCQRLIPKPDLYFICIAPTEVIQERKQEVPEHETRRQLEAYKALADNHQKIIIDNSGSMEVATEKCLESALSIMERRTLARISI